ncbi:MAG: aminoacyl-tRNA hydrolase [Alphaproteobacteria bacterium]
MLLIAGLGNPGAQYALNRHNFGFITVTAIAKRWHFGPWKKKFQSEAAEGEIGGVRAIILKPQTYYNESGRAVGEAMRFYKAALSDVVVFHDEIDLAPGRFRMKTGGGAAGNNGIRSITGAVGAEFRRARLGVGHPGHKDLVMGHALSNFSKAEIEWAGPLADACADAADLLAAGEDEKYQGKVLMLAPAPKVDPRKRVDNANE